MGMLAASWLIRPLSSRLNGLPGGWAGHTPCSRRSRPAAPPPSGLCAPRTITPAGKFGGWPGRLRKCVPRQRGGVGTHFPDNESPIVTAFARRAASACHRGRAFGAGTIGRHRHPSGAGFLPRAYPSSLSFFLAGVMSVTQRGAYAASSKFPSSTEKVESGRANRAQSPPHSRGNPNDGHHRCRCASSNARSHR